MEMNLFVGDFLLLEPLNITFNLPYWTFPPFFPFLKFNPIFGWIGFVISVSFDVNGEFIRVLFNSPKLNAMAIRRKKENVSSKLRWIWVIGSIDVAYVSYDITSWEWNENGSSGSQSTLTESVSD